MNGTAPELVGMLISRALEGIEAGKEVSINAVGTRGWVSISAIRHADRERATIKFTGRHGENEGADFYIPAEALLAVRVAEPTFP